MAEKTGRPRGVAETKPRPDKGQSKIESRMSAAERAREATKMRTMRMSWDQIAKKLGYSSRGAAYNAVQREIRRIPREAVTELRNTELEALDQLERAALGQALQGHLGAIDRVLRIKEARAKLTGLHEAPADTGVDEVKLVLTSWAKQVEKIVDELDAAESEDVDA